VTPSCFYFNKVNKFVEKARKEPVAHVAPVTGLDVTRVSGKTMSASNPTVINVVLNIVNLSNGPSNKILEVAKTFFR
jgi:hypothetical protein